MDVRFCPNCGESCEKEYETVIVQGQEFCVCCNYAIEPFFKDENFITEFNDEKEETNNAFVDFFNESGLINSY